MRLCMFVVESVVPYSPLSCISDHPIAPSPCMPPHTPDCFAVPSVGQSSSVKSPESVGEVAFSAESPTRPVSPKLQKKVSMSTIICSTSDSNFDVKCIPLMPSSQNTALTNDVIAGDNSINKKMVDDNSSCAVSVPPYFLPFSMMNVFSSEQQKNEVIDDVSMCGLKYICNNVECHVSRTQPFVLMSNQ